MPLPFAEACERNKGPILEVLRTAFADCTHVLEIGSGTGQHAVFFAPLFPKLTWQPTDCDPESLASIAAWREDAGTRNLLAPLELDVTRDTWPVERADAVVSCNMIHIAPWEASEGLFAGAARVLPPGAPLVLYGPFLEATVETAPSNLAFDASLKERNPAWGIRRLEDVTRAAEVRGFRFAKRIGMPANNLSVVFRRGQ